MDQFLVARLVQCAVVKFVTPKLTIFNRPDGDPGIDNLGLRLNVHCTRWTGIWTGIVEWTMEL